jgi:hypothetical protein
MEDSMRTTEDFSTVHIPLIEMGFAHSTIHSLHFDRFFNEEEKQANAEEHERLTPEEWSARCNRFWEAFAAQNALLLHAANDYFIRETGKALCQFDQLDPKNRDTRRQHEHYHFWLWYNEDPRFFSLTVLDSDWHDKENITDPTIILKALDWFSVYGPDNLSCRIQYTTVKHEAEIETAAWDVYQNELKGKFVKWGFDTGKVGYDKESKCFYFMKKYAKRKGFYINNEALLNMKPIEA